MTVSGAHEGSDEPVTTDPEGTSLRSSALMDLVERTVMGLGYELVDLERAGRGLLRVTLDFAAGVADSAGGEAETNAETNAGTDAQTGADALSGGAARQVGIEDCERVSRHLTHLFAVEDVDYDRLEVSSPGMDRPLRGARDFRRFAGAMAKVQLLLPNEGRRRVRGRLLGLVAGAPDGTGGSERVRMTLLPPPQAPGPKGARRPRAGKAEEFETIEFALADVEKARLAPEWEFDRNAISRTAQPRTR